MRTRESYDGVSTTFVDDPADAPPLMIVLPDGSAIPRDELVPSGLSGDALAAWYEDKEDELLFGDDT